jgi:hypothetical protein
MLHFRQTFSSHVLCSLHIVSAPALLHGLGESVGGGGYAMGLLGACDMEKSV